MSQMATSSAGDDLPPAAVGVDERVPHSLPQPFRMRDFLTDQEPSEVSRGPADRGLHHAGRDAKLQRRPDGPSSVWTRRHRHRLDAALVGIDVGSVAEDENFEA